MKKNLWILLLLIFISCTTQLKNDETQTNSYRPSLNQYLKKTRDLNPKKIDLGRKLFFDPKLSKDETVSCSKCHLPQLYGTDGLEVAQGVFARKNPRNAPTIINAALQFKQHWLADRENVEDQAIKSFLGHGSFGLKNYEELITKVKSNSEYMKEFKQIYAVNSKLSLPQKVADSIGVYERSLILPARFDDYLDGEKSLTHEEIKGLKLFNKLGCVSCHNGPLLGGNSIQKFGVMENYWIYTQSKKIDVGRNKITGKKRDKYKFKVPSLRNVTRTAPYFHDGSVKSLEQAVKIMAKVQLGKKLTDEQAHSIIIFLKTLESQPQYLGKLNPIIK